MTDKAEMPAEISVWLDRWGDHRLCAESFDDTTRYIRADLHDAQAAEIERLREALTIIVHQSTDLPSAIVTASRALVGE